MKTYYLKATLILISVICFLVSCGKPDNEITPEPNKGTVGFGINVQNPDNGRIAADPIPTAILISIKNSDDQVIYNLEKLTLVEVNGSYVSSSIELDTGSYTIEDFIVTDINDTSIYLTPKTGSEFESLVTTPLPYEFHITSDETTTVELDVISSTLGQASDFGYAEFTFNIVVDLEAGLVAYYPFNGNANDESGNELHGTVFGSTLTEDRNNIHNSAYTFDGVDDYIRIPNSEFLNFSQDQNFSISLWVNVPESQNNSQSTQNSIIAKEGNAQHQFGYPYTIRLVNSSNQVAFRRWDGIDCGNESTTIEEEARGESQMANQWYHIVALKSGSELLMFVNGSLYDSVIDSTLEGCVTSNDFDIIIGQREGDARIFTGKVDEVRFYNRILSVPEIQFLFEN